MSVLMLGVILPGAAAAQAPEDSTAVRVSFGAFVDAYYAYDANQPPAIDRAYTTQPARHNEFNVNLAHVEVRLAGDDIRGRLALQAGTSVQSNYLGEPAIGTVSGASLGRHIQEGWAGARLGKGLWVDAGIFFSHIGSESWLSRDNLTYSRSLVADYSPYYQAGVKATWSATQKLTAQLDLVNGWQNISENNGGKSAGVRLDYAFSPRVTASLYNLAGNEQPDSLPSRVRLFQGASLRVAPSDRTTLVATFDYGWQEGPGDEDGSSWYGFALIGHYRISPKVAVAARIERYDDGDQVIIVTGSPNGFQVSGASLGVDVAPSGTLLWRTELRGFQSEDTIYPDPDVAGGLSEEDLVVATSLALSL
jgi:hypothetical protein